MSKTNRKTGMKLDPRKFEESVGTKIKKEEKDWSFDDVVRSKTRRR